MEKRAQGLSDNSSVHSLRKLFNDGLSDIYSSEKILVRALPGLIIAASNKKLQNAFKGYFTETRRQVTALDKIFRSLEIGKHVEKCRAVEDFMEEAARVISEFGPGPVRDSALILIAQKSMHYAIAVYASLVEIADVLEYGEIAKSIDGRLEAIEEADLVLTGVARVIHTAANKTEQ